MSAPSHPVSGAGDDRAATILIHGGTLVRQHGPHWAAERSDLLVRGSTISAVEPDLRAARSEVDRVIDASDCVILPGLVNAHTHSYANLFRGLHDGLTLEPWAVFATAVTVNRTRREGYVSAALGAIEHLRTGTTAVLDHLGGSLESQIGALEAYRDLGLRAALAPMVSDVPAHLTVPVDEERFPACGPAAPTTATVEQIRDEMNQLFRDWHSLSGRLSILLGPSGPQRCSTELLEMCRDVAREHGVGIHAHLLETRQQMAFANERFGLGMIQELARLEILGPRFSGAHAVWCSSDDLELLADTGASVVHNPWSNLTLGSGIADLPAWKRSGIAAALGTDGVNCGGNLNMFRAMSLAMVLHRSAAIPVTDWPTVDDVLSMATLGGAQVIGAADRIGTLEVGREADLVIVDTAATDFVPADGLLNQLVHGETAAQVRTVLVAGRIVMENRTIPGVDLEALLDEAREISSRVRARNDGLLRSAELQREGLLDASLRATKVG